jgi:hypothetical protein
MTGEEMERAVALIFKKQALRAKRAKRVKRSVGEEIAETRRVTQLLVETQAEFVKTVTKVMSDLADAQE